MTNSATQQPPRSAPPDRQLRLLANLAPPATVVFGLITGWLVTTTLQNLALPLSSVTTFSVVVGILAAVLTGLTTYRLGIEVPHTLRSWESALVVRTQVIRTSDVGRRSSACQCLTRTPSIHRLSRGDGSADPLRSGQTLKPKARS